MKQVNLHLLPNKATFFKSFLNLTSSTEFDECELVKFYGSAAILINSARTALYIILSSKGLNRTDEILVPNYLSQCVLNIINKTSFPSHSETKKTKAVLALHQWGYPQKIDEVMEVAQKKGYLVIEDCAHSMTSKYKGKGIGLFGDASIFSFPKLFPTVMGGFLLTDDKEIINHAMQYRESLSGLRRGADLNRMMITTYKNQVRGEKRSEFLKESLEKCYSVYIDYPRVTKALNGLVTKAIQNLCDLEIRGQNLAVYKENFPENYLDSLEENSEVVPYFVPFFDSHKNLHKIMSLLNRNNIETSILHFDVNRNIFDSNYVECLALPCHQELSQRDVSYVCKIIKAAETKCD